MPTSISKTRWRQGPHAGDTKSGLQTKTDSERPAHTGVATYQGGHSTVGATGLKMILGFFVLGTGNHMAGWRHEGAFASHMELPVMQEIARIAKRGKFDLLFVSDAMAMDPTDHPSFMCRFEPTTLISVLSASTTHIGLGATVSTSFS